MCDAQWKWLLARLMSVFVRMFNYLSLGWAVQVELYSHHAVISPFILRLIQCPYWPRCCHVVVCAVCFFLFFYCHFSLICIWSIGLCRWWQLLSRMGPVPNYFVTHYFSLMIKQCFTCLWAYFLVCPFSPFLPPSLSHALSCMISSLFFFCPRATSLSMPLSTVCFRSCH